jgi:colanic acid biosynthesis glycosyl transferase WcaI
MMCQALRICVVSQYFWPESFRINDLVLALTGRGHSVQVLTGQPNYPGGKILPGYSTLKLKRSEALGGSVVRVPLMARGSGSGLRLAANYLSFAASARFLGVTAVRMPADVVLAYEPSPVTVAWPALALGKRLGVPVLMWIQDLWPDTLRATGAFRDGWAISAAGWLTRRMHRAMDGLLVQSRAFGPILESQGVAAEKITYLPNWAEDYFQPMVVPPSAPERRELPGGFVVLFAGNIGVSQGLDVLLGAAERLRDMNDLHWVVLGDGRQAAWLRKEIAERRLANVHLLGQRPAETMPTWFALADALLVTLKPDPVYALTIPSKVQAYMACGRPILASLDGTGAREVEDAAAGLTSAAGDADGLAAVTRKLYHLSAQDRDAMGVRSRAHYDANFDRQMLIERLEGVLQDVVDRRLSPQAVA